MPALTNLLGEGSEEKQNEDLPHFVSLTYQLYYILRYYLENLEFKTQSKQKRKIKLHQYGKVKSNIYLNLKHFYFITVHI